MRQCGPGPGDRRRGITTKQSFLVRAKNIVVCKALYTLYLTCNGQQLCEEAEEIGTEKLSALGKVTQQLHSRTTPFPPICGLPSYFRYLRPKLTSVLSSD